MGFGPCVGISNDLTSSYMIDVSTAQLGLITEKSVVTVYSIDEADVGLSLRSDVPRAYSYSSVHIYSHLDFRVRLVAEFKSPTCLVVGASAWIWLSGLDLNIGQ